MALNEDELERERESLDKVYSNLSYPNGRTEPVSFTIRTFSEHVAQLHNIHVWRDDKVGRDYLEFAFNYAVEKFGRPQARELKSRLENI
jgi:hypothetical protein